VITEVIPGARSVALGVMVAAGSRFESPTQHGASHLLEHLLFRGSSTHDGEDIADLLDRLGGDSNAFTDKEVMTAYVRTLPTRTSEALELLTSVITSPTLSEEAVHSELAVVSDEILSRDDEPADLAANAFEALCFPDHPLGRDVLGTTETLQLLDAGRIREYHEATYGTSRMVILAVGDVDHDAIVELTDRHVVKRPSVVPVRKAPSLPANSLSLEEHPGGQAHLVLGMAVGSPNARERASLAVLSHLLGGGVSSRLFREVREERGLAYAVGTEMALYSGAGSLSAFAASAPGTMDQVIEVIGRVFDDVTGGDISDEEVSRAKEALETDLLLSADEPLARMGRLGADALLLDAVVEVSERAALIESITMTEVLETASSLLTGPRVASLVGPLESRAVETLERVVGR
jgi:predicted Zn-dependent peptidase